MPNKCYKRLFRSLKIRLCNLYYRFLPPIKIEIDSLIYPNREDINLRINFINNFIIEKNPNYEDSSYIQFLKELNKHPYYINEIDIEKHIEKFKKLYYSLKSCNYQPNNFGYISVERVRKSMESVYPLNGKILNGIKVSTKYILVEGAHRIAILKVLGVSEVFVKRKSRFRVNYSDYTSFIKTYQ